MKRKRGVGQRFDNGKTPPASILIPRVPCDELKPGPCSSGPAIRSLFFGERDGARPRAGRAGPPRDETRMAEQRVTRWLGCLRCAEVAEDVRLGEDQLSGKG